ncbi:MAG TPA: site-2 protease family protein [Thermomicrobiales bacterium]|nr:site-2 protease family protein [Thermomicrobiales bacterium]
MKSLTIGRIQGIDIKLHPSFLLIALWVVYHWGFRQNYGIAGTVYGLVLVLAIFCLVLLHELGHSMMAHEYGLRVRDITLVPFGGIARIEQMPARPRAEAMISVAGPLVNLAIALLLLPLLLMVGLASGNSSLQDFAQFGLGDVSLTGFLFYLFLANLTLAIFNLLPAFPMDGGRILRAGVTPFIGRQGATTVAVAIGVTLGVLIGIMGLVSGQYLIVLVMAFVILAAFAEGRAVRLEESMRRLRVGQFAVWDRGGVSPDDPIAMALRQGARDLAVTDNGQLVGMVWRQQLIDAMSHGGLQRKISEIMDRRYVTISSDTSVHETQRIMNDSSQWTIPVADDGTYRGLFTADRLVHVQRHLTSKTPERRHFSQISGAIGQTFRGRVR